MSALAPKRVTFPSRLRLKTKTEFQQVYQKPFKVHGRYFLLLAMPNGRHHPRLGLGVSSRYFPRAVDRNRIKRQLRESFRQRQDKLGGLDIIVIAKNAKKVTNAELLEQITQQWQRLVDYWQQSASR